MVCSALLAGLQHIEGALGYRVIEHPELEGLMTHKDHQSTTHINPHELYGLEILQHYTGGFHRKQNPTSI